MREYHVYIMTNNSGTLYIGVSGDIRRRVYEHKHGLTGGFTGRYKLTRLVYVESTTDPRAAVERERQIKGWLRRRKIELIASQNPEWKDLSEGEFDPPIEEDLLSQKPERRTRREGDSCPVGFARESRSFVPQDDKGRTSHLFPLKNPNALQTSITSPPSPDLASI